MRQRRGRAHREDGDRLARVDRQGADRVQRGRGRDQRLTGDLTPRLKRRVVPVASHIIATEDLPEPADKMLIPGMRGDRRHQARADLLPALA